MLKESDHRNLLKNNLSFQRLIFLQLRKLNYTMPIFT